MAPQTSPEQRPLAAVSTSAPALSLSFNLGSPQPSSPTASVFSLDSSSSSMASSAQSGPSAEALAEDQYFSSNPAPKELEKHVALAQAFISEHLASGKRVVLVTSGGTTVPLEKQTVRFIDNFSAGTRGATSAEYFLDAGYAVIFLHRQFSLQPFSRHYSHASFSFLDFMRPGDDGKSVVAKDDYAAHMRRVLERYNAAQKANTLLMLPFTTITDYLYNLRSIASLMRPLGPKGMLYLAAAVSDFFVPPERMAEHKIQSTDAVEGIKSAAGQLDNEEFDNFDSTPRVPRSKRLIVDLDPVPKFLHNIVQSWASSCMIISFKLETDPSILVHKAHYALERYQHHLVVGNLLTTRKWEVVLVSPQRSDRWLRVPINRRKKTISGIEHLVGAAAGDQDSNKPLDPASLPEGEPEMEIESLIVPALDELHGDHIRASGAAA